MTEEVAAFAHMIQQPDLNLYQTYWKMQVQFMSYYIPCARLLALDLRQKMKTKLPTEWQEPSDQLGFQELPPFKLNYLSPFLLEKTS